MLSLKVARLGPFEDIECSKTKEITLDNRTQLFCRELNDELFKMKTKLIEIVNPSFIQEPPVSLCTPEKNDFVFVFLENILT